MSQPDLHQRTVAELADGLRRKDFSAEEAARHFLERARQHEALGAYLAVDEEATLAQARAADALLADALAADPQADVPDALLRTSSYLLQVCPTFSLRGGTREILRGMIARGLGLR